MSWVASLKRGISLLYRNTHTIVLSREEEQAFSIEGMSTIAKQFCLKRRSVLCVVFLWELVDLIYSIVQLNEEQEMLSDKLTNASYIKINCIDISLCVSRALLLICLWNAITTYAKFKESSMFSILYFCIKIFIWLPYLYIPYDQVVTFKTLTLNQTFAFILYMNVLTQALPILFLTQAFITHSLQLQQVFKENIELSILSAFGAILFLPLVVIAASILYQYIDKLTVSFAVIGYIGFVVGSVTKKFVKSMEIISFVGLLLFVAMTPQVLDKVGKSIWVTTIQFLLRYMFWSTSVRDVCIRLILFFQPYATELDGLMHNAQQLSSEVELV